jgi:hypothetical protein
MKNRINGTKPQTLETPLPSILDTDGAEAIRAKIAKFVAQCERLDEQGVDLAERFKGQWLPDPVRRMVARQRKNKATVKVEIEIPVSVYADLCAAAKVHGVDDWKEMLVQYLDQATYEWGNQDYYLPNRD